MVVGALADAGGWRLALLGIGGFALICGVVFAVLLPRSSFFTPAPFRLGQLASSLRVNLADTALLRLYLAAFTLTGALVTVYNYLTFRLTSAPFRLPATVVGAIFVVYLAGTVSSAAAGRLAGRFGQAGILVGGFVIAVSGALLTLPTSLVAIVSGLVVLTAGFFAAHSVASAWVGARARVAPAQASALYLCAFYVGSSVVGSAGGVFYARGGWPLTMLLVVALLAAGLAAATTMRVTPLRHSRNNHARGGTGPF
jgi:YNFM family putative membrane transporter